MNLSNALYFGFGVYSILFVFALTGLIVWYFMRINTPSDSVSEGSE